MRALAAIALTAAAVLAGLWAGDATAQFAPLTSCLLGSL